MLKTIAKASLFTLFFSGVVAWTIEMGWWEDPWLGLAVFSAVSFPIFFGLLFERRVDNDKKSAGPVSEDSVSEDKSEAIDEDSEVTKAHVFKEVSDMQIKLCKRNNWPITMVLFEIDNREKILSVHGESALKETSAFLLESLSSSVRESDLVGKVDDSIFAVLLPNCDIHNARKVIQRFRSGFLSAPPEVNGSKVVVSFSSGVASLAGKVAKYETLKNRAMEALITAMEKGGNRIELF